LVQVAATVPAREIQEATGDKEKQDGGRRQQTTKRETGRSSTRGRGAG